MNNLTIFTSRKFGALGVLAIAGNEHFPAKECAKILGYTNPNKAIRDHCKGVKEIAIYSACGIHKKQVIPEDDLSQLIVKSKLPSSEEFGDWVFYEVIPKIRRHAIYAKQRYCSYSSNIEGL